MSRDPATTRLYHITEVSNLPAILGAGGLLSDVALTGVAHQVIGYGHIKERRMTQYRVACCGNRFVGEFVPFYYCPRSPMLYTVNKGGTGKPVGCQQQIVHLVSSVQRMLALGKAWAIADGNAGAGHTSFSSDLAALDALDWQAIEAKQWQGLTHQKSAEFLLADFVPWEAIGVIGCHNAQTAQRASESLAGAPHVPKIVVRADWYY